MAAPRARFDALLKSREASENEALQEERRVRIVLDERRLVYDSFLNRKEELIKQIRFLRGQARKDALRKGDIVGLSAVIRFAHALERQVVQLDEGMAKKKVELDIAESRAVLAEKDVVLARIERKKIETLVEGHAHSQRVLDAARDEAIVDDFNVCRHAMQHGK